MPKQTYKIQGFHGGISSDTDPRDIQDIESPSLVNASIDSVGRIKTLGSFSNDSSDDNTLEILPNKGLFVMASDRRLDGTEVSETFIIAYDNASSTFDIKQIIADAWSTEQIALGTSNPVFYAGDGNLRIGDGAFSDSSNNKWFGYVADEKFNGLLAYSGAVGWVSENQAIQSPTVGNCLISDPEIGTDGDTVNSSYAEYDGTIADGAGTREPLVHSAVNLRVGFQKTEVFENDATAWSRNTGSPFQCAITEPAESVVYPVLGNNVLLLTGTNGLFHSIHLNNADGATTLDFNMKEGEVIVFGVKMSQAELDLLDKVILTVSSGTGNIDWEFYADELVADVWNICVANRTNYAHQATTEIDDDFTSMSLRAQQIWGGAYGTANVTNHSPDVYWSTPVKALDPGLEGYQSGLYTFHYSWLYDDIKQESLPFLFDDTAASDVNKVNIVKSSVLFDFDVYTVPFIANGSAYGISKRITGSRLYYKLQENDNYFLIGELDFNNNGFKWFPEGDIIDYPMVNSNHATGLLAKASLIKGIAPSSANTIDTYKSINGFGGTTISIDAKFKTAVVHGRRAYIGNISQPSIAGKNYPDRMLKSQVNKFDVFPDELGSVDVTINDGESIVKLETFADRILQFKEKTLYIINVSENLDFLEDTYEYKGCAFPYHVTKTDFGIAWFNSFGVYFYDGQRVSNLLEKNGTRLISESDWETFITSGGDTDMSEAHIGYIPKKRQLLIKAFHATAADIYIYDFVLQAWMKGASRLIVSNNMTNFALDGNQDLMYLSYTKSDVKTWNPSPGQTTYFAYQSKDIDFGEPGVRKKIYRVYVTYKTGEDPNVQVKFDTNGTTTFDKVFQNGTNFTSNILGNAGSGEWVQATLKPNTSSEANGIYSFALKLTQSGTVPATFEINDITIVYRVKGIR